MISRVLVAALAFAAVVGARAEAADMDALSGTYIEETSIYYYASHDVDQAEKYVVDDYIMILPHGKGVWFHFRANFDYGHICDAQGIADIDNGFIVFRNAEFAEANPCVLKITWNDDQIFIVDDGRGCSLYCGARGYISHGFRRNTRQPIEDVEELLKSPEYLEAVAEYEAKGAGRR